jgi:hypothetical protein
MINEDRAARAAEQQRVRQGQIARNIEYVKTQAADETKYPHVSLLPDDIVVERVRHVLAEAYKRTGNQYSFDDALGYLEEDFSAKAKAKTESRPRKEEAPASDEKTAQTSRTITNDLSSRSSSAPKSIDDMSDSEQKRYFAAQFKASMK